MYGLSIDTKSMTLSDLEQSSDHHLHVISHKTPTFGAICIVQFTETRFTHSQRQNEVSSLCSAWFMMRAITAVAEPVTQMHDGPAINEVLQDMTVLLDLLVPINSNIMLFHVRCVIHHSPTVKRLYV